MDELAFADATTQAAKIWNRQISSAELLEHYLARMDKYNPEINAIIITQLDNARERARAADTALAQGRNWGPLHGVPMTVKESYNIKGLPSTWGNPLLKTNIATEDAVAIERLQSAGAIIFGKTNVPLLLADIQSYNEIYGTTNNPHDLERSPGGSSGGSAAALAAGLTALEMGSDIGGSIRNPAHFCGVFGHKPTWGILPLRGHAMPGILTPSDISVIGPLARSAEDLRLAVSIIAGTDDLHVPGWKLELPEPEQRSLKDFKVAVWANDDIAPVDDIVSNRVLNVAKLVEQAGGQVDYDARPDFSASYSHRRFLTLLQSALSARQPEETFKASIAKRQSLQANDNSDRAQAIIRSSLYYREWHQFNEDRTHLRWAWHAFFKDYDILLTPICSTAAFRHDHSPAMNARILTVNNEQRPYLEQLFWAGLTGVAYLPSTIVPTGADDQGLPIGVQIAAREMGDYSTIEFARLVSEQIGGFIAPRAYQD